MMMQGEQNFITAGVWPTMVTPFTDDMKTDYGALEALVDWYIESGRVEGLFAVCQSSEMFFLNLEERIDLAVHTMKYTRGRVPVIASGNTSDNPDEQVQEISVMAETGVKAVVLLTNRFAEEHEGEDIWRKRIEYLLNRIPSSVRLGLYECPYPYKRVLSTETVAWCASLGRFDFYKDTSCEIEGIAKKIEVSKNSTLRIFNANSATLLESLKVGGSGYSGVMANFHPLLYGWLGANFREHPLKAKVLQAYLGLSSLVERQLYPMNAKYVLSRFDLPMYWTCRKNSTSELTEGMQLEMDQFIEFDAKFREYFFPALRIGKMTELAESNMP